MEPTAPADELRRAYVALARRHHPDRIGGDAGTMRALNDAWEVLGDPQRRALYDLSLDGSPPLVPTEADEPFVSSERDDLWADLADDNPIGGRVVLPRWLSMLPVGVFAASIGVFCAGLTFGSSPAVAAALALFLLSCTMFLAAPFVAMLSSRRLAPDPHREPDG